MTTASQLISYLKMLPPSTEIQVRKEDRISDTEVDVYFDSIDLGQSEYSDFSETSGKTIMRLK